MVGKTLFSVKIAFLIGKQKVVILNKERTSIVGSFEISKKPYKAGGKNL